MQPAIFDDRKAEIMDTQKQLIEKQREEIATVNKNWADDVKKNNISRRDS